MYKFHNKEISQIENGDTEVYLFNIKIRFNDYSPYKTGPFKEKKKFFKFWDKLIIAIKSNQSSSESISKHTSLIKSY